MYTPIAENRMWSDYGEWLVNRIGFNRPNYILLMAKLHNTPFSFLVDRDDNRASDGESLRDDFGNELGFRSVSFDKGCSVLEMLVALSIRMDWEYIGDPRDEHPEKIFWEMLCNLGLDKYPDGRFDETKIDIILRKWLDRDFNKNGYGSIFPLRNPKRDQTKIEIWLQMNEYLSENY